MQKTNPIARSTAPRRSRAEWTAEVARWRRSGLGAAEYAAERGLKRSTLLWWSCQLGLALAGPSPGTRASTSSVAFLPLRVREESSAPMPRVTSARIEVLLRNGRRIRVIGDVDAELLARVIEAAEGGPDRC